MNLTLTVLEIVAPVFLLATVGYTWVKCGLEYRMAFVTQLAMTLSLPCLVFVSLMETEIVLLISSGSTISEVAASIGLEEITISIYLDNACKSMGTRTVSQLVAKSLALGEIPDMYSA